MIGGEGIQCVASIYKGVVSSFASFDSFKINDFDPSIHPSFILRPSFVSLLVTVSLVVTVGADWEPGTGRMGPAPACG